MRFYFLLFLKKNRHKKKKSFLIKLKWISSSFLLQFV